MLLFLDVATVTGWACDGGDDGRPRTGLITLPEGVNGRHGHTFEAFRTALQNLIGQVDPRLVGYEAPIASMIYGSTNAEATMVLITLAGVVEMVCHQLGLPPARELNLKTIRKEFLGNGNAKKRAVLEKCKALGWEVGNDDNRADAAAGWCALHRLENQQRRKIAS